MNEWNELMREAEAVVPGREAVRLANLAVAAVAAGRCGLIAGSRDVSWLADVLSALAVEPLTWAPPDVASLSLLSAAGRAAQSFGAPNAFDAWVQAFQASDPARKSRGAYATPQALAAPMARRLLGSTTTPHRVVDPSAGAGGLLIAVLNELAQRATSRSEIKSHLARLYGVELDPLARELACLMLWLVAGIPDVSVQSIGERVVRGNAITRDWWTDDLFDALIMNPPWDSLRPRRDTVADGDLGRDETLARLSEQRLGRAELPALFSAQGRGDRNIYKAFVELAPHLLSDGGRLVALVPGGWSSDLGTAPLRRMYLRHTSVEQWTSFENLRGYFPIDGRYKFGVLVAKRRAEGTTGFRTRGFAADASDMESFHVPVTGAEIETLGGKAAILPDLVSEEERAVMLRYLSRSNRLLVSDVPLGRVRYQRELDMTEDRKRGAFVHVTEADATSTGDGTWIDRAGVKLVPVVEGRMVAAYEFHAKNWRGGAGRSAEWTWANGHQLIDCQPQFLAPPTSASSARIAICDVTSATNTRTVLASWIPPSWPCGNTAPVLVFDSERFALAGLAILNSMVFDWLARRLVAGLHLNRFYLEALSWPSVDDASVDQLAAAASDLTQRSPRYRDLADGVLRTPRSARDYVDTLALIESVVAAGYGLSRTDLEVVFSPDPENRRGFWRHFGNDPHSAAVVAKTLQRSPSEMLKVVAASRASDDAPASTEPMYEQAHLF